MADWKSRIFLRLAVVHFPKRHRCFAICPPDTTPACDCRNSDRTVRMDTPLGRHADFHHRRAASHHQSRLLESDDGNPCACDSRKLGVHDHRHTARNPGRTPQMDLRGHASGSRSDADDPDLRLSHPRAGSFRARHGSRPDRHGNLFHSGTDSLDPPRHHLNTASPC